MLSVNYSLISSSASYYIDDSSYSSCMFYFSKFLSS